jgi:hypothetical protein
VTSPLADDQAVLIIPPGEGPSAELVRTWAGAALATVPLLPRLRAVLVIEELVANARAYGGLPCVLRLSLDHTRRYLTVSVDDTAPDDGTAWPSGAGLTLVEALSSDWAVETRTRGKTVWAELALDGRIPRLTIPPQPPPSAWP